MSNISEQMFPMQGKLRTGMLLGNLVGAAITLESSVSLLLVIDSHGRISRMFPMQGKFRTTPLSYEALNYAWSFSSEQCPEGIVSVAGRTVSVNGKTLRFVC